MDSCNDVVWEGTDFFEAPSPKLSPPTGGSQEAHVVITGDSSGIVIQSCDIAAGAGNSTSSVDCNNPSREMFAI